MKASPLTTHSCSKDGCIVAFIGHMVDESDRIPARFPLTKLNAVGESIAERLRLLNVREGFSSAARGSDILFIEQLLDMKKHIHVFLPFPRQDFVITSVGFGWEERFYGLIKSPLVDVTELLANVPAKEQQAKAFDHCNIELQKATVRAAKQIGAIPILLTVWNGNPSGEKGGTADAVREWQKAGHPVEIIDISSL
jgi:hypothetical protein